MARCERPLRESMRIRRGCDMVSRSTAAMIARKKKATLKMAAREREIIWGAWEERERGQSSGRDGEGAAHLGAQDGDGGEW